MDAVSDRDFVLETLAAAAIAVVAAYLASRPGIRHEVIPGAGHALSEPAWNQAFLALILAGVFAGMSRTTFLGLQ